MIHVDSVLSSILQGKSDLNRQCYYVSLDTYVIEAVCQMAEHNIGAILIISNGRLEGIFSEKDLLQRVIYKGLNPSSTKISEVMSANPTVVGPETKISDAMSTMTYMRHRHLPVVQGDVILGMISSGDITKWLVEVQAAEIEHLVDYIQA